VRRAVERPVLVPTAVGALARLQVPKSAQGRVAVTRVEKRGSDATQVARPDELVEVVAVVVVLTPGRAWGRDERAGVRLVLQTVEDGERGAREHAFVAADLAQGLRDLDLRLPRTLEGLADVACPLLESGPRDLFRVGPGVSEADPELKRAGPDADLGTD
jgi:hypothetical protein